MYMYFDGLCCNITRYVGININKVVYIFYIPNPVFSQRSQGTLMYFSKVLTERFSILYKTRTKEDIRLNILTLVLVDIHFTLSAKVWIQL